MDNLIQAFSLMFTPGSELSQIILLTLQMAAFSTAISTAIGVLLGVCVGLYRFPGKRLVMRILNTLMGLPPVLAGLIVLFILSRSGPLGTLRLLYTLPAMVCASCAHHADRVRPFGDGHLRRGAARARDGARDGAFALPRDRLPAV